MAVYMVNRPVIIATGKFTVPAGSGEIGPPGSGATITIYNSASDWNGIGSKPTGVPFSRIVFTMNSSADSGASGVVFSEALDGVNFRSAATFTYATAGGLTTYDFLVRSPGASVKLAYTNSAAVLIAWEFVLTGLLGDRNPGQ
jgi:hypothetical protein